MLDLGVLSGQIVIEGVQAAQQGINSVTTSLRESASQMKQYAFTAGQIKGAFIAIGGAIAGISTYSVKLTDDLKKSLNSLQAETGASAAEMEGLEESLKNIYANNFGEDFNDIAKSMAEVKKQTNLAGQELEDTTTNALVLRDTFEFEVNESIRAVDMMMKQFGVTSEEAYNLIAQGAQNGLDKNQNLLDSINEYSVHFQQLGFNAEEMFNMFSNGAEAGVFDLDKLGDAVKEFGIRAQDGSNTTIQAFESLGFNAEEMQKKFAAGGETANKAFKEVTEALINCDNKVTQTTAGVNLFGTMYEDLGIKAIAALTKTEGALDAQKDVLTSIKEIKYDDLGSAFAGIGRQLQVEVLIPFGEKLLPYLNDFANWIQDNREEITNTLGGAFNTVANGVDWLATNLDTLIPILAGTLTGILAFKSAATIITVVDTLTTSVNGLKSAFTFLSANPIVAAFMGIGVAIGAVTVYTMDAKAKQKALNDEYQRTIELASDMTSATQGTIEQLEKEKNVLESNFANYDALQDKIDDLAEARDNANAKWEQGIELTEEESYALNHAQSEIVDAELAMDALTDKLVKNYGSMDAAKERIEAYKTRISNAKTANDLLAKSTDSQTTALINESLKLQSAANNAENLYNKYKILADNTNRSNKETSLMNSYLEQLKSTMGTSILVFDAETNSMKVNEQALLQQINATDAAANAKLNNAKSMIASCQNVAYASKEQAAAVIESCKAEMLALEAMVKGAKASGIDISSNVAPNFEELNSKIASAESYLNSVSTEFESVAESAGTTGTATKEAAKDMVDSWKETYDKKKKLGEIDAKESSKQLKELKQNHSDTAEHIIAINEFALSEELANIEERKETEKLTTKEIINLYEEASKNYATTYEDRKSITETINQEIKDSVDSLVKDMEDLNDEDLENLKDKLWNMNYEYESYGYDTEAIQEKITEVAEEQYQRQYDSLCETVDLMKEKQRELYDDTVNQIDKETQAIIDSYQAEIDAIEAEKEARENQEREQTFINKIETATDDDKRAEYQAEYDKWLQEQQEKTEKKRLQQLIKDAREEGQAKKDEAKTQHEEQLAQIDVFLDLEKEKLKTRKENRDKNEKEITELAAKQLAQQKIDTAKNLKDEEALYRAQTPILQVIAQSYGDALYNGITGRNDDINSYLSSLAESVQRAKDGDFEKVEVDGSHRNGLNYVPFDEYKAILHKGEMVLTQAEAERYRSNVPTDNSRNSSYNVTQNIYSTSSNAYEQQRQAQKQLKKLAEIY